MYFAVLLLILYMLKIINRIKDDDLFICFLQECNIAYRLIMVLKCKTDAFILKNEELNN